MGVRKGRQPVNDVLLNCSCGQLCLMPLGTLGNRAIYPPAEGAGAGVPQIPSVIAGASPQAHGDAGTQDKNDIVRPRDRGTLVGVSRMVMRYPPCRVRCRVNELTHMLCLGHCSASQLLRGHEQLLVTLLISCPVSSKYLGHVEVEESRGMHVCEDAVKKLKAVSEGLAQSGGKVRPGEAALIRPSVLPSPPDGPEVREVRPVGVRRWAPRGG